MSSLYAVARSRMLKATFDWVNIPARLHAFAVPYLFDESHATLSQVGVPVASSLNLTGQVVSPAGYARSDSAVLIDVPAGQTVTFLILAEHGPVDPPLIAFIDEAEGLPLLTNGLDQVVVPDWIQQRGWFRP